MKATKNLSTFRFVCFIFITVFLSKESSTPCTQISIQEIGTFICPKWWNMIKGSPGNFFPETAQFWKLIFLGGIIILKVQSCDWISKLMLPYMEECNTHEIRYYFNHMRCRSQQRIFFKDLCHFHTNRRRAPACQSFFWYANDKDFKRHALAASALLKSWDSRCLSLTSHVF